MDDFEKEIDIYDMPTPCQSCGKIFDLTDGFGSNKWFPNTVICEPCFEVESEEIEEDEEIQQLKETIENAEFDIKEAKLRLLELGISI